MKTTSSASMTGKTDLITGTRNHAPALPCRGCTASCKNYPRCNGKLWRMSQNADTRQENI